jgi:hypothetical protein
MVETTALRLPSLDMVDRVSLSPCDVLQLILPSGVRSYKVWWVEEPEQLLQFGLSQIADIGNDPQFLLVDDIQYLEDGQAQRFKRDFQKNRSLILVVAGRKLPPAFHVRIRPGAGLFDPYKAIDGVSILDKIAVSIPEWADTAEKLKAEPLWKARLIRILVGPVSQML